MENKSKKIIFTNIGIHLLYRTIFNICMPMALYLTSMFYKEEIFSWNLSEKPTLIIVILLISIYSSAEIFICMITKYVSNSTYGLKIISFISCLVTSIFIVTSYLIFQVEHFVSLNIFIVCLIFIKWYSFLALNLTILREKTKEYNNKNLKIIISLLVGFVILGMFIGYIYTTNGKLSESKEYPAVWKNGMIRIMGEDIQLPCDVEEFESKLKCELDDFETDDDVDSYYDDVDYYKYVELSSGLYFKIGIKNDKIYSLFYSLDESEESTDIVFPGEITIKSSLEEIKELYRTKPFNVNYSCIKFDDEHYELMGYDCSHYYRGDNYEICFDFGKEKIYQIEYEYIDNSDFE